MMAMPQLRPLPDAPDAIAPDLMEVRLLAGIAAGGMAHFRMPPRTVGRAVRHRTVEELWFFTAGAGRMWLATSEGAQIVDVAPGLSLSIPLGTSFQLRNDGDAPLDAVAVTAPPWPGEDEAVFVTGPWSPSG
jgi:mannose-6-phosphate isomerase-like protein (cupin superfamily)